MNDPVVLRDQSGRQYPSRVEGIEHDVLTVARPLQLPVGHDFGPGSEVLITWKCLRGIAVLPTRLIGVYAERDLALWSMVVSGVGWVEQRRDFVRIPAHSPLILTRTSPDGAVANIRGNLVDISEAALRCVVDHAEAEDLADRDPVSARFRFGDSDFDIPAHIGAHRPGAHSTELTELVVVFDEPVAAGDALRKVIFAQEMRSVRSRADGPDH